MTTSSSGTRSKEPSQLAQALVSVRCLTGGPDSAGDLPRPEDLRSLDLQNELPAPLQSAGNMDRSISARTDERSAGKSHLGRDQAMDLAGFRPQRGRYGLGSLAVPVLAACLFLESGELVRRRGRDLFRRFLCSGPASNGCFFARTRRTRVKRDRGPGRHFALPPDGCPSAVVSNSARRLACSLETITLAKGAARTLATADPVLTSIGSAV